MKKKKTKEERTVAELGDPKRIKLLVNVCGGVKACDPGTEHDVVCWGDGYLVIKVGEESIQVDVTDCVLVTVYTEGNFEKPE